MDGAASPDSTSGATAAEGTARPRSRRRGRRIAAVTALAVAGILVPLTGQDEDARAASLVPFEDCAALDGWFTDMALSRVGPYGLEHGGERGWFDAVLSGPESGPMPASGGAFASGRAAATAEDSAAGGTGGAVGPGATGTNVQEEGVDEPDLVKVVGDLVLTVTGDRFHVLRVSGGDLQPLGALDLPGGGGYELLVAGQRAVVVGSGFDHGGMPIPVEGDGGIGGTSAAALPGAPGASTTRITVVDFSRPAQPRLVRTDEVEGGYVSARASGGAVRLVLGSTPALPFTYPQMRELPPEDPSSPDPELSHPRVVEPSPADLEAAEAANRAVVEGMQGADWLPHRVVRDDSGRIVERTPAVGCRDVAHPSAPAGLGTTYVLTLDATAPDVPTRDSTAVAAETGTVYASPDRLYVATSRWQGDGSSTELHSFDTSDPDGTTYRASGAVKGSILGQWALDEHDGLMRVATTVGGGGGWGIGGARLAGQPSESFVTVLAEEGDELVPRGSVGGLGPDESIRSVRWFDDLALVVTFRQTDPLYAVDLSDPASPRVAGELKVNGYSGYLHPLGDGLVLGVGMDGTADGTLTTAQVSTFDVRDPAKLGRVDAEALPGGWTDVEGDSRAFSYLPAQRLALVPVSGESGSHLVAVRVAESGELSVAGDFAQGVETWLVRAAPVPDGVVTVSETYTEKGSERFLTLLELPGLTPRDEVRLD
ncbi:beta propeller domain-containing protein [Kineococcus xinjiangensis]|uniref:Beta propeller domain-containing protein n=1 Tax=Kineococcus xinjiangensis TaxID=512762 RepID=A0A2S6IFE5_9ACTN|nr:beta-propeller domain-containing protein [Kineococcus xinjiangensis]PPK92942.1 beta propeller domain-containing protein [Kineococcus xinjiangensis]